VTGTAPIVSSGGTAPAISISAATTSAAGSMSATDKSKLDGIAAGATAYADSNTRATALTGYAVGTNTALAATDTILAAFGKVQGQLNAKGTGNGTVTSVSVTTANGVSGTVATNTTTPAISITLGAITPSSVTSTGTGDFATPNSGTTGGVRVRANATSGYAYIQFTDSGATADWGQFRAQNGTMYYSGALTVNGNITSNSDARLKTNIRTLEGGLDKVQQLRGTRFEKDGREDIGFIAQEIETVLPELVVTADDEMGTKSVAYDRMTAVLLEAIKELSAKVDAQAAEIAELKAAR
jgi:hypothetical protein